MAEEAPQRGGFAGFLSSFLPERVEEETSTAAKPKSSTVPKRLSISTVAAPVRSATVDQELVDRIQKAVLANPSAYTKFLEVLERLAKVPGLNREAQIQATLAAQGVSAAAIAAEVDVHLRLLETQRKEFEGAIAKSKGTYEARVGEIEKQEAQIAELQMRVTALQGENDELQRAIAAGTASFEAAYAFVQTQLAEDKRQLAQVK